MRLRPLAVAAALLLAAGCQAPEAPAVAKSPPPSSAAATTDVRTVVFQRGERRLETTIVAPTGPGPFPIVLFGHGLGGLPPFYGELLQTWARAGFVVAAPAFPGTHLGVEIQTRDVLNQPADMSAVLDGLLALDPADPLRMRLDPERVAVAGHSAGAITAYGLFTDGGKEGRDTRFAAGILLAGNSLGMGQRFSGRPAPMLFIHAQSDPVVPASTGRSAYRAVPWPKAFLTLPGSEHVAPYLSPVDTHFATVTAATTDFLLYSLLGDQAARARLHSHAGLESTL